LLNIITEGNRLQ